MLYFAICGIFAFLTALPTAVFVLFNRPRTSVKILLSIYSLIVSLWGVGIFLFFCSSDREGAIFYIRLLAIAVGCAPLFFFHFVVLLTNTWKENKKSAYIYYVLFGIYSLVSIFWPQFSIPDVTERIWFRFYAVPGPAFTAITFLFLYTYIHGSIILYRAYQKASSIRRNQLKYFAIATIIGVSGVSTSFFLVYKIPIYPFGVICLPIYNLMLAYIIIKHHLLDIRVIIRKGLIYTFLVGIITFMYLGMVYVVERMFQNFLGYQSVMGSIAVLVFIAVLFIPLKDYIQSFVDKHFFKASYLQVVEQNDMLKQQAIRAERFQTMTTLSQRIIDELRNPLTALVGYGYQLPKRLHDKEFLQKFSLVLNKELQRLQALIQQLSDFSELKPLELQPINLTQIINELIEHLSEHLKSKDIRIYKYYQDEQTMLINADEEQVKRALYIFLANSVKLTSAKGQIWIGMEDSADDIEISIKDTGEGLSQEDLAKIFDPYFSASQEGEGANVSLAQAQNIIGHHGGRVMVDSQKHIGTEWIIQIPKLSRI